MTKEYVELLIKSLIDRLNLQDEPGDVQPYCSEEGNWYPIITRAGYRKVVARQEDYERHVVIPLYEDTKYTMTGDGFNLRHAGAGRIVGAVGYLYKKGMPGYFMYHVDCKDYRGYAKAHTSMPVLMTMKVCEVGLFRVAYPLLFANTYSEDEMPDKGEGGEENGVLTRDEKIRYIRENISISGKYIGEGRVNIENYPEPDLDKLYKKVKEVLDGSKAEN